MANNLIFPSPSGDKIRTEYVWNEDQTALEKVRDVDIQKEINEAAKGCTIQEQIARLGMGDTSVLLPGDPVYADLSEIPETTGEAMKQMEEKVKLAYAKKLANQAEKEKAEADSKTELEKAQEALAAAQAKIAELQGDKK